MTGICVFLTFLWLGEKIRKISRLYCKHDEMINVFAGTMKYIETISQFNRLQAKYPGKFFLFKQHGDSFFHHRPHGNATRLVFYFCSFELNCVQTTLDQ